MASLSALLSARGAPPPLALAFGGSARPELSGRQAHPRPRSGISVDTCDCGQAKNARDPLESTLVSPNSLPIDTMTGFGRARTPLRVLPAAASRPSVEAFCSERCKMPDLGRWISEDYRVPGEPTDEGLPTTRC